jgi:protein phosphatase
MGGAQAGEQASQEAVAVIQRELHANSLTPETAGDQLRKAILKANSSIFRKAQSSRELEGMGCTVVAVLMLDDAYWVASVGDSRVYLVREGTSYQLTDDHTWVNARVREGVLTAEQAANHSLRHVLDRALGTRPSVEVDIRPDEFLEEGDVLVMCTDGLYGVVPDEEIAAIVSQSGAQAAAQRLVEVALAAPTHDNVSVVVLQVVGL